MQGQGPSTSGAPQSGPSDEALLSLLLNRNLDEELLSGSEDYAYPDPPTAYPQPLEPTYPQPLEPASAPEPDEHPFDCVCL